MLTGTLPGCKIKKVRQAAGNDLPFNSHGQLNVNHVVEQNEEENHHDAKHRGFPVFHGNPPFWSMSSLQRQTALFVLCLIGAEQAVYGLTGTLPGCIIETGGKRLSLLRCGYLCQPALPGSKIRIATITMKTTSFIEPHLPSRGAQAVCCGRLLFATVYQGAGGWMLCLIGAEQAGFSGNRDFTLKSCAFRDNS